MHTCRSELDEPHLAGHVAVHHLLGRISFPAIQLVADAFDKVVEHRADQAALVTDHHTHLAVDCLALCRVQLGTRGKQQVVELFDLEPGVVPVGGGTLSLSLYKLSREEQVIGFSVIAYNDLSEQVKG